MAQPRPSLTLILDINERLNSEEMHLEIARCYSHVCPTLVRTHPTKDANNHEGDSPESADENTARFLVKMGNHRYLTSSDEGADDLWHDVLERWIFNELYKVSNNMKIFNRRQLEEGNQPLHFTWMEFDLQNGELEVALRCDSASAVDADASVMVTAIRNALNAGVLGENVKRVSAPTPASYEEQKNAGLLKKEKMEAEEAAAREEEQKRQTEEAAAAAALAEEMFLETVDDADNSEDNANEQEKVANPYELEEADFPIDYSQWLVTYADGSTRVFDSVTNTLQ